MSARKNHKIVVEALQELKADYWYVIIGKGDLKDSLKTMDHTGRLKLLGFRTDIRDLLLCSDIFVFPSTQEGLPVALMEAMAAGLTCLASDIRGNTDLLEKTTGHIIVDNNSASWINAIEAIDMKILKKNKIVNIERIQQFDKYAVLKKMNTIYSEILSQC